MFSLLIVAVGYLLGSIPFGYLIVRSKEGADVRLSGSGGTGATNVARRAGKAAGLLTLVLDAAKGALAVSLARWLVSTGGDVNWWVALTAVAAIVGHIFPIWLGFRGGKGVATGLGCFLSLSPMAVLFSGITFVVLVLITRYVSLGSMVGAATFPFWLLLLNPARESSAAFVPVITAGVLGSALIIMMHHANIRRLLTGQESRFR